MIHSGAIFNLGLDGVHVINLKERGRIKRKGGRVARIQVQSQIQNRLESKKAYLWPSQGHNSNT